MFSKIKGFNKWDPILFSIIFLVLAWIFITLPPISLYSNDEGAKYIQMKNFYLNDTLAVKYPGRLLGLDFHNLLPFKHHVTFVEREDKMYCVFPPFFSYLSSLFYPLFGDRVTHLLPLLAYFLSLLVLSKILRVLVKYKFLYYLLQATFLVGSPIFIYAFTFWEHVPAVFLVIGSLYFLVQYFYRTPSLTNIFFSSGILSSAIFFRTEIFILMMAYTLSLGWILSIHRKFKEIAILIIGQMIPLLGYAAFNWIHYQSIIGLHILYNVPIWQFSLSRTVISIGITLGCVFLAFLVRRDSIDYARKEEVYSYIPILWIGLMLCYFSRSPILNLFLSFPVVLLIFIETSKRIAEFNQKNTAFGTAMMATIIIYIWLISYFFYQHMNLDVRFCLPIIPIVIIFIAAEHQRIFIAKSIYWVFIALFLISASYGGYTLKNDVLKFKWYNAERIEFLKKHTPEDAIVIFQYQPLMEHAGPLFYERFYLVVNNPDEINRLFEIFKRRGFTHCFYMTSDPDLERFQYSLGLKSDIKMTRFEFKSQGIRNHLYLFKFIL